MHSTMDTVLSKTVITEKWSVEGLEISECELEHTTESHSSLRLGCFISNCVNNQ